VHGPDPGTGQHGDDGFGDHGQVHGHPVALGHTERLEGVGGLLDLFGQLRVGVGAGVARFAFEMDGHPVPEPVLHVPVQGVVRGIDLAADEPLRERRVGPVQGFGEVRVPVQQFPGLPGPERGTVRIGFRIDFGADYRVGRELRGGRELPVFVKKVFEGVAVACPVGSGCSGGRRSIGVLGHVNLIIHRSLPRGCPVSGPPHAPIVHGVGLRRLTGFRKELFRNPP
jgi:hypothetical protein